MKPFFFLVLVALAGAVLAALVWIVRLRKALRQKQEENQRLKRVLLLGSHSAQEDLSALRKLRHESAPLSAYDGYRHAARRSG